MPSVTYTEHNQNVEIAFGIFDNSFKQKWVVRINGIFVRNESGYKNFGPIKTFKLEQNARKWVSKNAWKYGNKK